MSESLCLLKSVSKMFLKHNRNTKTPAIGFFLFVLVFFKVINYHLKGGTVCVNMLKKFLLCCGLGLLVFPKPLT